MFVFYTHNIENDRGILDAEEMHHCIHVLRHKVGDSIHVTDGLGHLYTCRINSVSKSNVSFTVENSESKPIPGERCCVAMALTKSMDRMEWFVEKAVELGVSDVVFYQSQRSERSKINAEKLKKTAIAAMKQARHCYLPNIRIYTSLSELLAENEDFAHKFVAFCHLPCRPLADFLPDAGSKLIVIGPEGDFSPQEVAFALGSGLQEVALGTTILRAETAAVVAAALLKLI